MRLERSASFRDTYIYCDFRLLALFISLPSVQRFTAEGCHDLEGSDPWACGDFASNVKELVLLDCKIASSSIRTILRSCRALEALECTRVCIRCYGSGPGGLYSYASILQDLVHHKDSPRILRLYVMSCGHYIEQTGEHLGSLAPLKALTLLDIDEDNLVGRREPDELTLVDVLPDNLEKIVFRILPMYSNAQLYKEVARILINNNSLQSIEMYHSGAGFTDELELAEQIEGVMPEVVFESDEWGKIVGRRR